MADEYGEGEFGAIPYGGGGPSPSMSDINGSFERAGADPGDADLWNFQSVATGFGSVMAYFGLGAQEDFSWIVGTWYFFLELIEQGVSGSPFGALIYDDFEAAWENGSYSFGPLEIEIGIMEGAEFSGNKEADDMEDWYDNTPALDTMLYSINPAIVGRALSFPLTVYLGQQTLRFMVGTNQFDFPIPAATYSDLDSLWTAIGNNMIIVLGVQGLPINAVLVLKEQGEKIGFEAGEPTKPVVLLPVLDNAESAWSKLGFSIASNEVMRRYHEADTVLVGDFDGGTESYEDFEEEFGFGDFDVDWDAPGEATFAIFDSILPGGGGGGAPIYETFSDTYWPDDLDPTI